MQNSKFKIFNFSFLTFNSREARGFTLLELIISLAVFSVVVLGALGSLLAITNAQKRAVALQTVQDNINFAFELMTKEIRTGSIYHCGLSNSDIALSPQDCDTGGPSFTFRNARGQMVTYRVEDGHLEKIIDGNTLDPLVLTAAEVTVEYIQFYVLGSEANDQMQPRVTIVMKAVAGEKEIGRSRINLQTTVSQRQIDS